MKIAYLNSVEEDWFLPCKARGFWVINTRALLIYEEQRKISSFALK